jgi:asparagine synthase (glutamine-hydrolysing)
MCGIAGIVGAEPSESVASVQCMLAGQRHRGPEGQSVAVAGDAVFGQCQLAFVAIGLSLQPHRWNGGRTMLVFNGEIYNHHKLRASLAGHPELEGGPGEAPVLAALYSERGADMAQALEGMFAVAIHDAAKGHTLLLRDRFGKKPLYYHFSAGRLSFASELRALCAYPRVPSELSAPSLARYLSLNAVPAPDTIIDGVNKVRAGTALVFNRDRRVEKCYWRPSVGTRPRDERTAIDQLDQRLRAAVRTRIPGEARLGAFMSGGLDSTLVAALAAGEVHGTLPTFSVGFPDAPSYDETPAALAAARTIGTDHLVVPLTMADLADQIPGLLFQLDEPVADPSFVPTAILARAARRTVKAVFTGDGADEMAMGYRIFAVLTALRLSSRLLPARLIRRLLRFLGGRRAGHRNLHYAHVARLLHHAIGAPPERLYYAAAAAVPNGDWASVLQPHWAERVRSADAYRDLNDLLAVQPAANPYERLQLGMICHFLRDVILTKLDRATMLASLEARSPFLDVHVAEELLGLQRRLKLRGTTTKYIVRRLAQSYLPPALVGQRKRGFRIPLAGLFAGPLKAFASDMLSDTSLRQTGLFRSDAVEAMFREHRDGRTDHHRVLWSMLCMQSWAFARERKQAAPPPLAHDATAIPGWPQVAHGRIGG